MSTTTAGRASRVRLTIGVAAALAVLVLGSVLAGRSAARGGVLDPDNPDAAGAQAIARVLADEGVEVTVVRDQASLRRTDLAGARVVVSDPTALGRSTLRTLRGLVADAEADLLLLGINPRLPALAGTAETVSGRVSAACDDPALAGLTVAVARTSPVVADGGEPAGATACFASFSGPLLVTADGTTRFSGASILRNDAVIRADNAAVALRLLGAEPRLVWYVPSPADTRPTDGVSLTTLLPPWVGGALVLGVAAFVAFVVVWGRRLGPLVHEPVPVAVRSAESTLARGRLYAAARDRDHAAAGLRAGTATRLRDRTGLGGSATLDALVGRLGERGQDESRVRDLLADAPVEDDRALVELASDLTRLEDEVARP